MPHPDSRAEPAASLAPAPVQGDLTGRPDRAASGLADVLLVVRTATTLNRLLDVVPVFADDHRVRLHWTIAPGSAYDDGLPELLERHRIHLTPWAEAVRHRYGLALAASANGRLHQLRAPLLLLPHGAGFNKRLGGHGSGAPGGPSGLTAGQLLHRGRPVAAAIGLGHPAQLARLALSCPPAAARAVLVGDPCHDRIRASLPWRDEYRRAFGLRAGQQLVVVSSTWGPASLSRRHPELLTRLLAELPVDEYRVALVLHPNEWAQHGAFGLRLRQHSARTAGLIAVPPHEGWRAALVAARVLIGDHGSVSLYAAAAGLPVLLATDGGGELDPASPMSELISTAPQLDLDAALLPQLAESLAPAVLPPGAFAAEDGSLALLAELAYRRLGLTPPARTPTAEPVPLPRPDTTTPARRLTVHTTLLAPATPDRPALVRLERHPSGLTELHPAPARPAPDGHTRRHRLAELTPESGRAAQSASVLTSHDPDPDPGWPARALERHPACRIAAVVLDRHRCLLRLRTGELLTTTLRGDADPLLAVSALHHLLTAGQPVPRSVRIEIGGHRYTATIDRAEPAEPGT
ncbi:translation initiation factor 2 [Kitasatospora sp. NPDC096147]|uniref:translation initiation factor 2 n=1 Tax=Kitasatospora sp. NPDC096147 TaxID=3364093 RepID=UPI003800EF0B